MTRPTRLRKILILTPAWALEYWGDDINTVGRADTVFEGVAKAL